MIYTAEMVRDILTDMPMIEAERLAEMMGENKRGWECGAVGDAFVAMHSEASSLVEEAEQATRKAEDDLNEAEEKVWERGRELDALRDKLDEAEGLSSDLAEARATIDALRAMIPDYVVAEIERQKRLLDEAAGLFGVAA